MLLWACLAAAAGTLALLAAVPPYASADETAHVDYAYQVWHGRLPEFFAGPELQVEHGAVPPVQWVSQHPPLSYLLLAPVVGPLVDAGHPVLAAYAGRLVTLVAAVGTVLVSGWAARWVTGRWGPAALLTPVLVASHVWVLRLGAAVYTDIFLALVVTALLGLTARWLRVGRHGWAATAAWVLLPGCAAAIRLSGVPLAALCVGAVGLHLLLRRRRDPRDWLLGVVLPVAVAVAGTAWFYLRNRALTGSVTGAQEEWAVEHLERELVPLSQALTSGGFWTLSFRQFAAAPGRADWINLALFVVPALVGVAVGLAALRRQGRAEPGADRMIAAVLACAVLGVTAQQLLYVTHGGGAMGRYFAVLVLPFALAVAAALGALRAPAWALGAWCALHLVDLVLDLRSVLARFAEQGLPTLGGTVAWPAAASHALLLAAAVVAVGLALRRTRDQVVDRAATAVAPGGSPAREVG